jgi:hypothetical protein
MNFIFKLFRVGIKNCVEELKVSINELYPEFPNFRRRFNYSLYVYFLPITATCRGVKIAWSEKL